MSKVKVEWIDGLPFYTLPNEETRMTYEQAKKILHPNTTLETLAEIEYYAGFNGEEAKRKAVDEACLVACKVLDKMEKCDYITKELRDLMCDINIEEIVSHIREGNLGAWINIWRNEVEKITIQLEKLL